MMPCQCEEPPDPGHAPELDLGDVVDVAGRQSADERDVGPREMVDGEDAAALAGDPVEPVGAGAGEQEREPPDPLPRRLPRKVAVVAGHHATRALNELLDPRDHLVDAEVVVSIRTASCGRLHPRVVGLVAQLEVGRERVRADVRPLGLAAARAHRRVGLEVDLHLGLGARPCRCRGPRSRRRRRRRADAGARASPRAPPGGARPRGRSGRSATCRIDAVTSVSSIDTRPSAVNTTGFSRRAGRAQARRRAGAPVAARATSGCGTSRPCRGSGSRAARRGAAPPCSCPAPAGPSIATIIVLSATEDEELEEAGEADVDRLRALEPHALARGDARDRAEHRDAVVAGRVDRAAARAGSERRGSKKPSGARLDAARRSPRSAATVVSMRSDSFARSSSAPRIRVSPCAIDASSATSGSSSTSRGTSAAATTFVATSVAAGDLDVADLLARRPSAG